MCGSVYTPSLSEISSTHEEEIEIFLLKDHSQVFQSKIAKCLSTALAYGDLLVPPMNCSFYWISSSYTCLHDLYVNINGALYFKFCDLVLDRK